MNIYDQKHPLEIYCQNGKSHADINDYNGKADMNYKLLSEQYDETRVKLFCLR